MDETEGQVDGIDTENCKVAEKGYQIHRRLMAELVVFAEKKGQADIELVQAQKGDERANSRRQLPLLRLWEHVCEHSFGHGRVQCADIGSNFSRGT